MNADRTKEVVDSPEGTTFRVAPQGLSDTTTTLWMGTYTFVLSTVFYRMLVHPGVRVNHFLGDIRICDVSFKYFEA